MRQMNAKALLIGIVLLLVATFKWPVVSHFFTGTRWSRTFHLVK